MTQYRIQSSLHGRGWQDRTADRYSLDVAKQIIADLTKRHGFRFSFRVVSA